MIDLVISVLKRWGLLPPRAQPECSVMLGHAVSLQVRFGKVFLYAKVSPRSLRGEWTNQRLAYEVLPGSVPQPLLLSEELGFDVLVSEGIEFTPLGFRPAPVQLDLLRGKLDRLYRSFQATTHPLSRSRSHVETLRELVECYKDYSAARQLGLLLKGTAAAALDELPHAAQHCDLVRTNIGVRKSDKLVIYDWEDLGATTLPGFDAFTLRMSLSGFTTDMVGKNVPDLLSDLEFYLASSALQYEPKLVDLIICGYRVIFHHLKISRGYACDTIKSSESLISSELPLITLDG